MTRPLWLAGGFLLFALGWIGLVMPMMPGVVFFIVAAFCFARSSPAWEQRLMDHPHVGHHLRDWRERRAISRKGKRAAVIMMAVAGAMTWFIVGFPWALVSLSVLVAVAAWIWTRPE